MWVDQLQGLVQEFSVEGLHFDTVEEHKSRSLRDVRHLFDLNQHLKGAHTSCGQPSYKSRHLNMRLLSSEHMFNCFSMDIGVIHFCSYWQRSTEQANCKYKWSVQGSDLQTPAQQATTNNCALELTCTYMPRQAPVVTQQIMKTAGCIDSRLTLLKFHEAT